MKTCQIQTFMRPALIPGFALAMAVALLQGAAAQDEGTKNKKSTGSAANRVLALDGKKASMQVPDTSSVHAISNSITLEAWCLANSFYPDRGSVNSIIRKNVDAGDENFFLRVRNMGDGPALIEWSVGSALGVLRAPFELKTNSWYHLAGAYDGATMTVYVNGNKIREQPMSGNLTVDAS